VVEVDVRPQRAQQRGADLGELDGGPCDLLDLPADLERETATRAERADEAPIPALGSSARTIASLPASSGRSGQSSTAIASAITVGV